MSHEQSTIIKDDELVLKSSGLQGVGTVTSAGKAIGPTGLVKAVINVTVVASGGTLDVHLEESSDDAVADAYADIANAVFSQITAVGIYELYFRAAEKWSRYVGVVGTAAVTWEMLITTAER
jgi:hypothetical protein